MKLWIWWVLATTAAFGLGGRLGVALSPSRDLILIGYQALASSLVIAGVLQWLILRRLITESGWWMLASVVAVAALGALVFALGLINRDVGWVAGVVAGWIVLGALQSLVLRGHVPGAGWWVLASALGLIAAGPVVGFVTWATGASPDAPAGEAYRWLAFGGAYGVVTGAALRWLMRAHLEAAR